jgi:spore maturation protein CgeB
VRARWNVAFFGSSLVSTYWNGAATYYRGIVRQLDRLGHRVRFYEPDAFDRQRHRDMPDPPWCTVVVYDADEAGAESALDDARSADVVVKASGVGVLDELLEREISGMASERTTAVFWDVDAPATLERLAAAPGDALRDAIPRFDLVLTYGGGDPVVEGYLDLGARRCLPIYNALDPDTHFPVTPEERFSALAGLLAHRLPDREARIRDFFVEPARRMPTERFLLGGAGWERDFAPPANLRVLGHVPSDDHNAFNSSVRAVINVNRDSMARFGFSPPTRIFEAAGAAACIVTDRWDGIEHFLAPDKEILVAGSGDEVVELLRSLTPERARRIGVAARDRVLSDHTYSRRAEQVVAALQGAMRWGSPAPGARSAR